MKNSKDVKMRIHEYIEDDEKKIKSKRKNVFIEKYNPEIRIDVKKTANSFGVSIQTIYKWIRFYNDYFYAKKNNKKTITYGDIKNRQE